MIGKLVHYYKKNDDGFCEGEPKAAIITNIKTSGAVDLKVFAFDYDGNDKLIRCVHESKFPEAECWIAIKIKPLGRL